MSIGVDSDYEHIVNKIIDKQRTALCKCHDHFNKLAEMIKYDKDFTNVIYSVIGGDTLQYEVMYKTYRNYRFYFRFNIQYQLVELDVRLDKTKKDFAEPTDDKLFCVNYSVLSGPEDFDETFESRAVRLIMFAKDRVNAYVEADNERSKGYLTAAEFTEKVQDLMHPDKNSYVSVDPISGEQANLL